MIDRGIADAACAEAEGALLSGDAAADAATRARVDRHLGHCQRCQQTRAGLERLRDDVSAGAPPLDDVRRARLLARLAPLADGLASRAAARRRPPHDGRGTLRERLLARPRSAVTAAMVMAAGCGALALLITGLSQRSSRPATTAPVAVAESVARARAGAPQPPSSSSPSSSSSRLPSSPAALAPAIIKPYRATGAGVKGAAVPLIGRQFQRLDTPAATVVRARLGDRTDATLVGPAEVSVLSAAQNVLDVGLQRGTLVVDFDHRGGGRLRSQSPGAVTEVVGTLLAVEVSGAGSRISVSRGRVVVQPAEGPPRVVSAGQSFTVGTPPAAGLAPAPPPPQASSVLRVPARTAALMAQHDGKPGVRLSVNRIHPAVHLPAAAALPPPAASAGAAVEAEVASIVQPPPAAATSAAPPPSDAPAAAAPARPAPPPAPPPVAIAPAARPRAAAVSAEEMYRQAEGAMVRRDWIAAERALQQIIATKTGAALEDVARYELAQLALRDGSPGRAARWLDELIASDREPALRESARFLRCDVHARAGESADERRCLEGFRARYPASRRDADALGALLRLTPPLPCDSAGPLAVEYLRRYPSGADVQLAARRSRQCPP